MNKNVSKKNNKKFNLTEAVDSMSSTRESEYNLEMMELTISIFPGYERNLIDWTYNMDSVDAL